MGIFFFARHGGEQEARSPSTGSHLWSLQQGSFEVAPGSASMAVEMWPSFLMVEGQPLPPSPPGSALSGWLQMANINFPAVVPRWRPFSSGAVGSRRVAPSCLVLGGIASGYAVACRCSGDGAGPDGVSSSSLRVGSA